MMRGSPARPRRGSAILGGVGGEHEGEPLQLFLAHAKAMGR